MRKCGGAAAAAKSLQSCPTLCDPIDGSPPGSPVPGILQARGLEWVAISFSSAWKWKVKVKSFSRVRLFTTPCTAAHQAPPSMGFSRQEYWSGMWCRRVQMKTLNSHCCVTARLGFKFRSPECFCVVLVCFWYPNSFYFFIMGSYYIYNKTIYNSVSELECWLNFMLIQTMYKYLSTGGPSPWSYPDDHFLFVLYCLLMYESKFQLYFIKEIWFQS